MPTTSAADEPGARDGAACEHGRDTSHCAQHPSVPASKYETAFAGGIAGLVSRFVIAPLDVVKIRLQLQTHAALPTQESRQLAGGYNSRVWHTVRSLVREEGVRSLWKGNLSAELMYVGYGTVQFGTYATLHQFLADKLGKDAILSNNDGTIAARARRTGVKGIESFLAGAVSGGVATLSTYPFDLLRTRFAAQGTRKVYHSLLSAFRTIHRDEGLSGFFRGSCAAVAQISLNMGTFFSCYEIARPLVSQLPGLAFKTVPRAAHTEQEELKGWSPFSSADALAGSIASITAKTLVFPLDTVRKRLQVQGPTRTRYVPGDKMPEYAGVVRTAAKIVREQGVRQLYQGLGITLVKAAPASAVTMWVYEGVLREVRGLEVTSTDDAAGGVS
ncbi:mitochondrial thiamine pyrophosphate transporter [Ascosphaera acerosa]|nr:mitochondrial thiamine pyrophosphate transporter [Ascosphaera acerosa]